MPPADTRPPSSGSRGRLRLLFAAGITDSLGMSLGWTVVVLAATAHGGTAQAALCSTGMLAGVVLSAPACGWLAQRLTASTLLPVSAALEMVLRGAVLTAVLNCVPPWLTALLVAVANLCGWVAFAAMRAEVVAADTSPRSITRYAMCIAGSEAAGSAVAALLPSTAGRPAGWLLAAVAVAYPLSLLPTLVAARGTRPRRDAHSVPAPAGQKTRIEHPPVTHLPLVWRMAAGSAIMLISAGPLLLAVPIIDQVHGNSWVAAAAFAFAAGTLLAGRALALATRRQLPATLRWLLWGLSMLAGWTVAPAYAPMVLLAEFGAGLGQTALEGDMDAQIAARANPATVTRDLAYAAAVRALGGAMSVRLLALVATPEGVGRVAAAAAAVLTSCALLVVLARRGRVRVRRTPVLTVRSEHLGRKTPAGIEEVDDPQSYPQARAMARVAEEVNATVRS